MGLSKIKKGIRYGFYFLVLALLVFSASAQEQTDRYKYELIRETINFLATDKIVSQDTTFRISCESMDYECFEQQLSDNPIAGIDRWYRRWQSIAVTDEAGLNTLRSRIFADIFERPGKGYRKQLAGYNPYIARVTDLVDPRTDDTTSQDSDTVEAAMALVPMPVGSQPIYPEQFDDENEKPEKENTMIAYIAIVIGLLALAIAALPFIRKKESRSAQFDGLEPLNARLEEIALRMKHLEQKAEEDQMADAINHLTEIMEGVEKRVVELERRVKG